MATVRKRGRRYHARWVDEHGVKRERAAYTDRRESQRLADELEAQAARIRDGLVDPRDLALREHARTPVAEHIEAFGGRLTAKGGTPKHVDETLKRVRRLAAVVKGATLAEVSPPPAAKRAELAKYEAALSRWTAGAKLADLTADAVQRALRSLVDHGSSHRTANAYRVAIKTFSRWCLTSGRLASDPLAGVSGFNPREDRRHDRRTLSTDELRRLIEAAHSGPPWRAMSGPARSLLYRLAVATGLRYSELQSITPASFDWRAEPATVRVEAGYTKNGDVATLSIPPDLAGDLRPFAGAVADGEPVFHLADDRGATMLRGDLERAGIPYRDASGLVFDFHALRCQTATLLDAAGVSPRVAQRIMRHSTPGLTDKYTRPRLADVEAAALSLPSLRPTDGREAVAATDGSPPPKGKTPGRCEGGEGSPAVAHYLPTTGDDSGRCVSRHGVAGSDDAARPTSPKPLSPTGVDASSRVVSRGNESAPRRTRTFNPLIKSQLLCQLS